MASFFESSRPADDIVSGMNQLGQVGQQSYQGYRQEEIANAPSQFRQSDIDRLMAMAMGDPQTAAILNDPNVPPTQAAAMVREKFGGDQQAPTNLGNPDAGRFPQVTQDAPYFRAEDIQSPPPSTTMPRSVNVSVPENFGPPEAYSSPQGSRIDQTPARYAQPQSQQSASAPNRRLTNREAEQFLKSGPLLANMAAVRGRDRGFGVRASEGQANRDFKATEGEANRGLKREQGDLNRQVRVDKFTSEIESREVIAQMRVDAQRYGIDTRRLTDIENEVGRNNRAGRHLDELVKHWESANGSRLKNDPKFQSMLTNLKQLGSKVAGLNRDLGAHLTPDGRAALQTEMEEYSKAYEQLLEYSRTSAPQPTQRTVQRTEQRTTSSGGTVWMKFPDGSIQPVSADKIDAAKAKGGVAQ